MSTALDLVAIGRVSVDLYGQQIGSRLEDVTTFARAVGGCPANVAIGAARLGLRSALITRVGDEPMGRFVREQLAREGVDTRGVTTDPQRLTPLVLLSVRDAEHFPLIFYRENCADSVLAPEHVAAELIGAARAVLVTGTHFALEAGARAQLQAVALARAAGGKVVLDIDYRPSLWGIGGHDDGASRYARSARVTATLAAVLPDCDLIVGTEEEMHIAAGAEDTLAALRSIRARSRAVLVVKRGAAGCVVFDAGMPQRLEDGLAVPGMPIEVYNVLGAGDAFLAGFLRGYLRDEPHAQSARYANACGALAVSRLLCSAEFPSLIELEHYLAHGSRERALRHDATLNHLHWVTTARRGPEEVLALAAGENARAAIEAVAAADAGRAAGVLLGAQADTAVHATAAPPGLWLAQRVDRRRGRPLEAARLATDFLEWPRAVTAVCRCEARPADDEELIRREQRSLLRVHAACRTQGRELALEVDAAQPARLITGLYAAGIKPDWWLLAGSSTAAMLAGAAEAIAAGDAYCRGALVVLEAEPARALMQLRAAAASPIVRGFIAAGSMAGPAGAVEHFRLLAEAWRAAKERH